MSGWPRFSRYVGRIALSAVIVALAIAYLVAWQAPASGTFHDDGIYMVTAKAIAEGKGYSILSLPGEPPQTKYPPLFPLLLAPLWKVDPTFPDNASLLKLLPLVCGLLWLGLSYQWMRASGGSREAALGVTLLAAGSAWTVFVSTALLSETLFAMLTTGALLCLLRAEQSGRAGYIAGAAVCAGLAFQARTVGVALVIAIPCLLLYQKKVRQAVLFAGLAAMVCAPWLLWVAMHKMPASGAAYYSSANYSDWNILLNFTFAQKAAILGQNVLMTLLAPAMLAGFRMQGWVLIPGAVLGAILVAGVWCVESRPLRVFLAVYTALVVCWAWAPTRFLVPILPLVYWAGWRWVSQYRRPAIAVASITIAVTAWSLASATDQTLRLGDALPTLQENDSWYRLADLLDRVRTETPPDALLAGNLDPLYYLYTGRKAIRGFQAEPYALIYQQSGEPLGSSGHVVSELQRQHVTYWLRTPNSTFLEGKHLLKIQKEIETSGTLLQIAIAPRPSHVVYSLDQSTARMANRVP